MIKIYLASPYSDSCSWNKELRFRAAAKAAGMLIEAGHICFSPICHSHPIAEEHGLPGSWDFWHSYDRAMIEWADVLMVLCLDKWDKSQGVMAEIAMAQQMGKRIFYWHKGEELPNVTRA